MKGNVQMEKDCILETIRSYFGDLEGVPTEEFYNEYLKHCEEYEIEPQHRQTVIKKACDLSGVRSKQITEYSFVRREKE